jgi:hypothetical protein
MKVLFIVITLITFLIFLIEGVIHYNVGVKSNICESEESKPKYKINFFGNQVEIPEKKEVMLMCLTVLIFSSINGLLTAYIIKHHLNSSDK